MTRLQSKYSGYEGNIEDVRAVEDAIRASQKYTEGVMTMRKSHPIQGEDFPSKVFCKFYEVYPKTKVSWDMPVGIALDWLMGEYPCVDVVFRYDYRGNKASVTVQNGSKAIKELVKAIPNFGKALMILEANGRKGKV